MADDLGVLFAAWKFQAPGSTPHAPDFPAADRIAAAIERVPFVSVVAPAGSGKTTALSAWSAVASRWRTVWVRLDAQDDDAHMMARAIGAGMQTSFGHCGVRLERLLGSQSTIEVQQLATAIALDLDECGDVVLVLDDLHHLRSEASLQLVEALLDGFGPSSRLLTASRVEPPFGLHQRRVRRQLVELTGADLRLDRAQIEALLADVGERDLTLAQVILNRSAGWAAAAVLMVANAHAGVDMGTGGVDGASLQASEVDIDAFLRSEILHQLDPELQRFVLETALLDSLDVASCAAVAETNRAAELLEEARRRGLLERVVPLATADSSGITMRYHDRIAGFLRAELAAQSEPADLAGLHRRAASVSSPMRAIDLLLDIGDVSAAASAVTDVGRTLIETPGGRVPRSWLARFDANQLASEPWLALLSSLAAIEDGDIGMAAGRLAPVVDAMRDQQDRAGLVRSAYGLAETHLARGEVAEAAALIDELVRMDTTPDERVKVLMAQLWLDYFGGDWDAVGAGLDEAFALAFTSCSELGRCTLALGLGTEFLFAPRGTQWLQDHCAELALRIRSDAMALTSLEVIQAAAHLVEGDLSRAEELAEGIDERALELGSLNWLAMASDRVRLGLALAQGDLRRLDAIVDAARQVLGTSDRHHQERAMYAYATARAGWLAGRPDQVRAAGVLLGEVTPQDRPDTAVTAAVIASMVHRHEGDVAAAERALIEVRDVHHVTRFCLVTGLVDLELAALHLTQGRASEAVEAARPGLRMLARLDGVGLLALDGVDTHRAVLDACRSDPELAPFAERALERLGRPVDSGGVVVPDTNARLSVRELDVIRQVMTGASNREVGERLFIGERTVKSHMTSLMRKLNVTSRTAAIARAHELGIS